MSVVKSELLVQNHCDVSIVKLVARDEAEGCNHTRDAITRGMQSHDECNHTIDKTKYPAKTYIILHTEADWRAEKKIEGRV